MRRSPLAAVVALAAALPLSLGAQPKSPVYTPGALTADQRIARAIYEELAERGAAGRLDP